MSHGTRNAKILSEIFRYIGEPLIFYMGVKFISESLRKVTSKPSRESQPETRLGLGDSAVKFEWLAAPDASRNDSVNSIRLELSAFSL